jgi:hypothetical protein
MPAQAAVQIQRSIWLAAGSTSSRRAGRRELQRRDSAARYPARGNSQTLYMRHEDTSPALMPGLLGGRVNRPKQNFSDAIERDQE